MAPTRLRAALAVLMTATLLTVVEAPGDAAPSPVARTFRPSRALVPVQHEDRGLKQQYDAALAEEQALVARVQRAQAERSRLEGELRQLETDLQNTNVDLLFAQAAYDETQFLAEIYAQAVLDAKEKVEIAQDRLRRQIVSTYVKGGADASVIEALLKATSGEEVGQALTYSKAVVGDTRVLLDELEDAREQVRQADKLARDNRDAAQEQRDEIEAARNFIAAATENQKRLVTEINFQVLAESEALFEVQGRKAIIEGRINAMNQSSDGVAMLLASIQRGQPDWNPGVMEITTPIPGYRIGSAFGMRHHPILQIDRLHAGGDIGAPSGTPIHAVADGTVVVAGERGGYGLAVVIDHGHSLGTLYGHQSSIAVRVGQEVERGDVIGYVGSTGLSTGPHLHIETRLRGMPINPEGVIDFEAEVDYGR
ncbi:MAG: peptidoglycan DD-metalloendopeptidase family protein [Acidimicrobiales bacterium]|nr:peptidoglycan DD-metalloendopeptidase family protein [Acidimicrobiales bacterium]